MVIVGCLKMRINDCRVIKILNEAFISRIVIAKIIGVIINAKKHLHHHSHHLRYNNN